MTQVAGKDLSEYRIRILDYILKDEADCISQLIENINLDAATHEKIEQVAIELVENVRAQSSPTIMEGFLAEYGLSTKEGISLMCLAEALMRVPDVETMDALIADKIVPSNWGKHLGHAASPLINAATWGLMLTGKVLDNHGDGDGQGIGATLHGLIKNLGEPVVRQAVSQAMREMGRQFVLGRTIEEAMARAKTNEEQGYSYSYDMLGEAAMREHDAQKFHLSYSDAITAIAKNCGGDIRDNPGISVKLSALYPRYESTKYQDVMTHLVPRVRSLALLAKSANMGFNIDAEEADRLDLSLDVIKEVLKEPALAGWDGFGVVVQAYGKRAPHVLDYLYNLAIAYDRKIMVRLVKGAYWDSEIKRAQELGLKNFPVFTRKENTDISYMACAKKLLEMGDRIYAQFATHNAHTVASILTLASDHEGFEFQRLHGMGEALHETVIKGHKTRCRIYAPVGAHKDLLAYLVRRLLENGANSSFVNQIVDENIPAKEVAACPFEKAKANDTVHHPNIIEPQNLFGKSRKNSMGLDVTDKNDVFKITDEKSTFENKFWDFSTKENSDEKVFNPFRPDEAIGSVTLDDTTSLNLAIDKAKASQQDWARLSNEKRAEILINASNLYENNFAEIFALCQKEAGKTINDAIGELREAVDFLRYYATQILEDKSHEPRGLIACISPWNFPLAIFTGQISAALAAGNAVLAKAAEQTPLIAHLAVKLLHQAGVPKDVLQLIIGDGKIGAQLVAHQNIDGVCFTGSTEVAQIINRSMADHLKSDAMLIAETGGLNAMIVDSTALPEQAVRDILASSFQSAGQRCSALRILYLQDDIAENVLELLYGAMDMLALGDPKNFATDIGPVIDKEAQDKILSYCKNVENEGRILKKLDLPKNNNIAGNKAPYFVPPHVIHVEGISDISEEIFGPVLHVARFKAFELPQVIEDINQKNYGLTFGLHTRVDGRVQEIVDGIKVGNIYVNRNQISAIVGSQPFGGEGLSGTGPKAGGPQYLKRFFKAPSLSGKPIDFVIEDEGIKADEIETAFKTLDGAANDALTQEHLPGPTGEDNILSHFARGKILCLAHEAQDLLPYIELALDAGNQVIAIHQAGSFNQINHPRFKAINGMVSCKTIKHVKGIGAVVAVTDENSLVKIKQALALREGELIPMITELDQNRFMIERHLCVDQTASGGNASLLSVT